jgi:hypothetical protein
MRSAWWVAGVVSASVLALSAALAACSSNAEVTVQPPPEIPTAKVEITVQFGSDKDASIVATVHGWVLGFEPSAGATCSKLVGGDISPYDVLLERRAEMATMEPSDKLASDKVVLGEALVYVEASGFDGNAEFAGCVTATVAQPLTAVTVTLGKARVYDCKEPQTPEGALCDDGKVCTAGERCKAGVCGGGVKRTCSHLADQCNAASCDEALGCVRTPVPDNTTCDDTLMCTEGDACFAGKCTGKPRDCSTTLPACQVSLGCSELSGQCEYDQAPGGTECDDEDDCTENDVCTSYGTCQGSTKDCSSLTTQCATGQCATGQGCVAVPKSEYSYCNDNSSCTSNDHCDGNGACVGTPKNCGYYDDQCNKGGCVDPGTGQCVKVPLAVGTPCTDFNSSTLNDQCNANGVCVGQLPDAGAPDTGVPDSGQADAADEA